MPVAAGFGILVAMRRVVAVAMVALGLTGVAGAATGPTLRLASAKPFVVSGSHFKARERVLVTLTVDRTRLERRARATLSGAFRVDFGTVTLGHCSGFTVRAVGSGGSGAVLKRPPLPACIPQRSP
jgi:hypothetical protein